MKKMQYLQPQTKVVLIQNDTQLLEGSPNKIVGEANSAIIDPDNMGDGNGSDAASRHSIWDDDCDF